MPFYKRIKFEVCIWWWYMAEIPSKVKRRIWNKRILLWWNRLWIRKNEFHRSLDMDHEAMLEMTKEETDKYRLDLAKRRAVAHKRVQTGI